MGIPRSHLRRHVRLTVIETHLFWPTFCPNGDNASRFPRCFVAMSHLPSDRV